MIWECLPFVGDSKKGFVCNVTCSLEQYNTENFKKFYAKVNNGNCYSIYSGRNQKRDRFQKFLMRKPQCPFCQGSYFSLS